MTGNREAILGRARRLYAMANQTASEAEARSVGSSGRQSWRSELRSRDDV